MKNKLILFLALVIAFGATTISNGQTKKKKSKNPALFTNAVYEGNDDVYYRSPLREGECCTCILQGTYPDPARTRQGDGYYVVCSSYAMFPGVPILHSKDLVSWTDLGGVLDN